MSIKLFNPKTHTDSVRPHSMEWYAQLGRLTGQYSYSSKSTITEPNGESIFTNEVSQMVPARRYWILAVGMVSLPYNGARS